jgi:RNA polymerase sigma-70 factor (ECF subfamily)
MTLVGRRVHWAEGIEPESRAPSASTDEAFDEALVMRAQNGNASAFAILYSRHSVRLERHCLKYLGNTHDAADATQETFLRAWRSLAQLGGERRFYPWLRAIATNVCIDALRMSRRVVPGFDLDMVPEDVSLDEADVVGVDDLVCELHAALDRISKRHRDILWMREQAGWTYQQIATHEQLELSAVKSLLWRARQSLRRELLS